MRAARSAWPAPRLCATGPNQMWVWDITLLPTTVKGRFLPMFVVKDLYSRMIVAAAVHDTQDTEHAVALFTRAFREQKIAPGTLTVHADNGPTMRACALHVFLRRFRAWTSRIRPGVSNDNAHIESLLRTLKVPLPRLPFDTLEEARAWAEAIVRWYNTEHRHSALHHVTPSQCHRGEVAARLRVREMARKKHPEHWTRDRVLAPEPAAAVLVNPWPGTQTCVMGAPGTPDVMLPLAGQTAVGQPAAADPQAPRDGGARQTDEGPAGAAEHPRADTAARAAGGGPTTAPATGQAPRRPGTARSRGCSRDSDAPRTHAVRGRRGALQTQSV